ncbi:Galactoside-binding lectin [Popillia japonica]|uniref:Galectin n=1 Tax=Popillia japonica TaxID=7064 RepID=A0AAW1NAX4_POPJA
MEVELSNFRKSQNNSDLEKNEKEEDVSVRMSDREQTPVGWPMPNGFPPGYMIRIHGLAHRGGKRFETNFALGPEYQRSKIAFHSSFRFGEGGDLVNNSYDVDRRWEDEQRWNRLPISPGQYFEILILCEPTKFKVAIGGVHFCDFEHRVPFTNIKHLDIRGDVTVALISYEDNTPQQRPTIDHGYPI